MTSETTNNIIKRKWFIFWLMVFGAVLVFDLSLLQVPKYEASSKVLIIQRQTEGQDVYTISKSAQYLSRSLREGIYSDNFFDNAITVSDKISLADFPESLKDRRKLWQKEVKVDILQDLGVMKISVLNVNPDKAKSINEAIVSVLRQNHALYHGAGDRVEVKLLDYPMVGQTPAQPNLWLNSILGGLAGLMLGLVIASRKKEDKNNHQSTKVDQPFEEPFQVEKPQQLKVEPKETSSLGETNSLPKRVFVPRVSPKEEVLDLE